MKAEAHTATARVCSQAARDAPGGAPFGPAEQRGEDEDEDRAFDHEGRAVAQRDAGEDHAQQQRQAGTAHPAGHGRLVVRGLCRGTQRLQAQHQ